jgi:hypothetical protein
MCTHPLCTPRTQTRTTTSTAQDAYRSMSACRLRKLFSGRSAPFTSPLSSQGLSAINSPSSCAICADNAVSRRLAFGAAAEAPVVRWAPEPSLSLPASSLPL